MYTTSAIASGNEIDEIAADLAARIYDAPTNSTRGLQL